MSLPLLAVVGAGGGLDPLRAPVPRPRPGWPRSASQLERRAEEVLAQEELAPRRWADRLAPEDLPEIEGFEVGRVYEAGTGLMAGDFYDVFPDAPRPAGRA